MALLYRFTRLGDGSNTGIFTFIVTRTVTRDIHRDAVTKDFNYGYHRWALSFIRTEKTLGVFLVIRNPAPGSRCCVDFTLTILNREHFSKNEAFSEKQVKFSTDQPAHGAPKWLLMQELATRRFADETGEFLLELSLSNVTTLFDADIKIPPHYLTLPQGLYHHEDARNKSYSSSVRIESTYLSFGGFEWNVALLPFGSPEDGDTKTPKVLLNRLTGFDHPCRVQYRLVLGENERKVESGLLDQISDLSGRIRGFPLRCAVKDLTRRGSMHVHLQMVSANVISEAKVPANACQNMQELAGVRDGLGQSLSSTANCYDGDKQAWCVETDFERDYLRLKLFYSDMHHVPRNHLRYVAWNTYVIRAPPGGGKESVLAVNAPHSAYYVQDGMDLGVLIDVDIPTRVIREQLSPYLDNTNHLTIHIEWLDNQLLFGANYHRYDDIARIHCQQMRREVTALQAENYNLERQVFSYQKSISYAANTAVRGPPPEEDEESSGYLNPAERGLSGAQSLSESEYA